MHQRAIVLYKLHKIILISLIFLASENIFTQTLTDTLKVANKPSDSADYFNGDTDLNLCKASYDGNAKAVLDLLNKGAKLDFYSDGRNALHYAILNGHLDVVQILVLNGADVNLPAEEGETPLIMSVRNGFDDITDFLCQKGALPDSCDDTRRTPLMFAVANGSFLLADMLLFYGANLSLKDFGGNDAFMLAVYTNQTDMASYLHIKGADINTLDLYNNTPLIVAAEKSYPEMIDSLLNWGANSLLKNKAGFSVLAMSIRSNSPDIVKSLIHIKIGVNENIRPGIKPRDLAKGKPSIDSLLRSAGGRRSAFPDYNEILIGFDFSSNFSDYMNDIHLGLFDPKFFTSVSLGFHARMAALKLYVPKSDQVWYQYRERRYFIWAGLDKQLTIIKSGNWTRYGLSLGLKAGYTFGNYRGSSTKAASEWLAVPSAQLFFAGRYTTFSIGYEYAKYPCFELSPGHLTATVRFHFPSRSEQVNYKNIYWIQTNQ